MGYYNGIKQGEYRAYHKNGQIKVEGNHIKNFKEGEEKRYFYDGQLEWAGSYLNNDFDNHWIQYNISGDQISVLKYKKGKLKGVKDDVVTLNSIDIPNGNFEQVPVYPGCEDKINNTDKKTCMSASISQFVSRTFNTGIADDLGLEGRQRINVIFIIDKTGKVNNIRARAPHPELEKEAIRVISKLPKMTPGIQRAKAVNVPFSLPILFQVKSRSRSPIGTYYKPK